jgi:hypothetical protein
MKNSRAIVALSIIFLTFLLTPTIVLAQSATSNPTFLYVWTNFFKFDREWLSNPNQLMVNAIIPSFAIFAITLGLMRTVKITYGMGRMEYLIALAVMLAALFTGGIGWISGLLTAMGIYGVIMFVAVFFIGVGLWAYGYVRGRGSVKMLHDTYVSNIGALDKQIEASENEIKQLSADLGSGKIIGPAKVKAAQKRLADLQINVLKLHQQKREIMTQYKDVTT